MKKFFIIPLFMTFCVSGMGCLPAFEHLKHKMCHQTPCAGARIAIRQGNAALLKAHLCSKTINQSDETGYTLGDYILDEAPKGAKAALLSCLLRKGFNPFLRVKNRISLVEQIVAIHNVALFKVLTIRDTYSRLSEQVVRQGLVELVSLYPRNDSLFASFVRERIAAYWGINESSLNETYGLIKV